MNKSILTNLISVTITFYGLISPVYSTEIFMAGLFSLSGGLTNWLAIHMLFEKIPFIIGSGVVEIRFEEFKKGIRHLILEEFFNKENIENIYKDLRSEAVDKIKPSFDKDKIFNSFIEILQKSSLSKTLDMFGGAKILEPLKDPLVEKFQQIFIELVDKRNEDSSEDTKTLEIKIITAIDIKLNDLTPRRVKEIVQEMISKHLGWLVVWGTIFGGAIGLIFEIITN